MRAAYALAVDLAVLVAFAALGRRTHDGGGGIGQVLLVAAPFALAWVVTGAVLRLDRRPLAWKAALLAWAIAVPAGLALRATAFGRGIAPGFVVVALLFTVVTLVGWRLARQAARARWAR